MSSPNPSGVGSLELAIQAGLNKLAINLHTALPGVVEAFNEADQTADVQVEILRTRRSLEGKETTEAVPLLLSAPVWLPRAGGFSISLPLAAGDEVLVLFCERDIDEWMLSGGPQEPRTRRRHDFSDALILPGLTSQGNRLSTYSTSSLQIRKDDDSLMLELRPGDSSARLLAPKIRLGSAGTDIVAELIAMCAALESAHPALTAIKAKFQALET